MDFEELRKRMVDEQMIKRGIRDTAVLKAMRGVPRHEFIPPDYLAKAYEDCPLPIGEGQTISQPYMVALMTQCLQLRKSDWVLEIGTGSGYQTAVLAEICEQVFTLERIEALSLRAQEKLQELGYKNIQFKIGDGSLGWVDQSVGFDGIIITAASNRRLIGHLFAQLNKEGRFVVPLGDRLAQDLTLFTRSPAGRGLKSRDEWPKPSGSGFRPAGGKEFGATQRKDQIKEELICRCVFVPLIGKFGLNP